MNTKNSTLPIQNTLNKPYLLALNRISGIGPKTAAKLLRRFNNLAELFQSSHGALIAQGLPERLSHAITQFDLASIEADLLWEQSALEHHLLTWEHPQYPPLLKEIHDPPIVLYASGNLSCLQSMCLAIVGTRSPSITGRETAKQFATELANHSLTVVSGLALGIDAAAHQGALLAEGQTIAVLGSGIDLVYPYRHRELAQKIITNGLVISEFPINSSPAAGHFPRRNRIISGLSKATLVVEAAIKSGSLITARFALEQNRDVMAIPGSIHNPKTSGCHYLLQQGAQLVTSVTDILEALGLETPAPTTSLKLSLATKDENLVNCLGFEVTTLEQISARSGLNIEEVACNLAILEIKGIIAAVPGGYMRCAI